MGQLEGLASRLIDQAKRLEGQVDALDEALATLAKCVDGLGDLDGRESASTLSTCVKILTEQRSSLIIEREKVKDLAVTSVYFAEIVLTEPGVTVKRPLYGDGKTLGGVTEAVRKGTELVEEVKKEIGDLPKNITDKWLNDRFAEFAEWKGIEGPPSELRPKVRKWLIKRERERQGEKLRSLSRQVEESGFKDFGSFLEQLSRGVEGQHDYELVQFGTELRKFTTKVAPAVDFTLAMVGLPPVVSFTVKLADKLNEKRAFQTAARFGLFVFDSVALLIYSRASQGEVVRKRE